MNKSTLLNLKGTELQKTAPKYLHEYIHLESVLTLGTNLKTMV